jgi:hypothetical protein
MLKCFGEEEPASFARVRLIVHPCEEVLVQEVEQKKGGKCETIDDRGYNGIAKRDDNQLSHRREEGAPLRCTGSVLNCVHRARGRSKEGNLEIIYYQRPDLKKSAGCSGKTLKEYEAVS